MPDTRTAAIRLTTHVFGSVEEATKVADDIKNRGEVKYIDASGSEVSVTIGDVTVES